MLKSCFLSGLVTETEFGQRQLMLCSSALEDWNLLEDMYVYTSML